MYIGIKIYKYYSATKRDEILPFATTWMDLESIMLREISQTEKDIMYDSMWNHTLCAKIEGGRRRGRQRMRWLDGITDSVHESEQAPGDGGGQGSLVSCRSWGRKESDTTEQLNNSNHLYVKSKKQMNKHN